MAERSVVLSAGVSEKRKKDDSGLVYLPVRFRKLTELKGRLRAGGFPLGGGKVPSQPNQSLMDSMRVLQVVLFAAEPVSGAEVARQLQMELTRAHRLLRTLSMLGMTYQTANKRFTTGPAMHILSAQALLNSDLAVAAKEPLDELHRETGLEVALGMLWQDYVSYIYHASPDMPLDAAPGQVSMFPASRSSLGHVLLAGQSDEHLRGVYEGRDIEGYPGGERGLTALLNAVGVVRSRGFARVERPDQQTGRVSIAIALSVRPFAAIGVGGDISASQTAGMVEKLTAASAAIANRLA